MKLMLINFFPNMCPRCGDDLRYLKNEVKNNVRLSCLECGLKYQMVPAEEINELAHKYDPIKAEEE